MAKDRRKTKRTVQVGGRRDTDDIPSILQKQEDRLLALENQNIERTKQHDELMAKLGPMIDSFNAAVKLGKWSTSILIFISVGVGITIGIIKIFHHK